MNDNAGVWIDHRRATIVIGSAGSERISTILSGIESHQARHVAPDDRRQMALTGHLDRYYDKVIAALENVGSLLIFGPGEAKGQLATRIRSSPFGGNIVTVTSAEMGNPISTVTNAEGYFQVPYLIAGSYKIAVELQGFDEPQFDSDD